MQDIRKHFGRLFFVVTIFGGSTLLSSSTGCTVNPFCPAKIDQCPSDSNTPLNEDYCKCTEELGISCWTFDEDAQRIGEICRRQFGGMRVLTHSECIDFNNRVGEFANLKFTCNTSQLGVCSPGTWECSDGDGIIRCLQDVGPSDETCDGLDNDCNGQVDDDITCPDGTGGNGGADGTGGSGGAGGSSSCVPTVEACDGLDNDCNGQVDDGNPGGGQTCGTGLPGVCADGTTECKNSMLVCAQTMQSSSETCNGLDDDCDGQIDEGLNCCSKLGESCTFPKVCCGQLQCVNGTCQ